MRRGAAFSMCTRRNRIARCGSNFSAMRSSRCGSSIRRASGPSNPVDEALLLPLTETPVTEELLGSINARLSGNALRDRRKRWSRRCATRAREFFPVGVLRSGGGRRPQRFRLLPDARVILDEPEALALELDQSLGAH